VASSIVYIDRSRILPGRLDEVRAGIVGLVAFIEEREPRLLHYAFYVDEAALLMTVVAVHPDSASLELHLEVGREEFRKLAPFIELQAIEVFGVPRAAAVEQLRSKAAALGTDVSLVIHDVEAGFSRSAAHGS
jgi:hypothetical protein